MVSGRISILDESVVNKIAAGEVVERPASVVKELIENSIDAKASRVNISIVDGGTRSIAVTDDGEGMSARTLCLPLRDTQQARYGPLKTYSKSRRSGSGARHCRASLLSPV